MSKGKKPKAKAKTPSKPQRTNEAAKTTFDSCIGDVHRIKALLIPVQYAALYDVPFDVSDALVIVIERTDALLDKLDRLETAI